MEFIGRRLAYARGEIDKFDPQDFDIYPFTVEAVKTINAAARGNPRDIRMLARGCQQVAAENFRRFGDPMIDTDIAELVAEAYKSILQEVG